MNRLRTFDGFDPAHVVRLGHVLSEALILSPGFASIVSPSSLPDVERVVRPDVTVSVGLDFDGETCPRLQAQDRLLDLLGDPRAAAAHPEASVPVASLSELRDSRVDSGAFGGVASES